MRLLIAMALVVGLGGRADALTIDLGALDEHTRNVVAKRAPEALRGRIIGGIALLGLGVGIGALGYYTLTGDDTSASSSYVDVDALRHGVGYSALGVGGLAFVGGALALILRSDVERWDEELNEGSTLAEDVRRSVFDGKQQAERRRRAMRIGGTTALVGGALAAAVGFSAHEPTQRNTFLIGGGIGLAALGAGVIVGSFVRSDDEKLNDAWRIRHYDSGIVPVRGGAIAAIAGTF